FRQSANNETNGTVTGLGNIHWINSIVQASNSRYFEGMSNFQRTIFTGVPATTGNVHTLSFSHQFTKAGIHAYDFLTSWEQAKADDAAALVVAIQLNECGKEIGPPASLSTTCGPLRAVLSWTSMFRMILSLATTDQRFPEYRLMRPSTAEQAEQYEFTLI